MGFVYDFDSAALVLRKAKPIKYNGAWNVIKDALLKSGEIKEEEAWATYSRLLSLPKKYEGFMDEFHREIKAWPIRGTGVEYTVSPWEIKDGQFDF